MLTDDYSRYRWVRLLRSKSHVPDEVISFIREVEREKTPAKVSVFRADGGGEFDNQVLSKFFKELGIRRGKSLPLTPSFKMVLLRGVLVLSMMPPEPCFFILVPHFMIGAMLFNTLFMSRIDCPLEV